MSGQSLGKIQGAWPPHIMFLIIGKLTCKTGVAAERIYRFFQHQDQGHQRFGHEATTVNAESARLVWLIYKGIYDCVCHYVCSAVF